MQSVNAIRYEDFGTIVGNKCYKTINHFTVLLITSFRYLEQQPLRRQSDPKQ